METLTALPNLEGRKFGTLSLGYDRITKIREEFGVLLALASLVTGVPSDQITEQQVVAAVNELRAVLQERTLKDVLTEMLATPPPA